MRELRTTFAPDGGDWELASRPRLSDEPMTVHAVGRIAAAGAMARMSWADAKVIGRIDGDSLYRLARNAGLDYGRRFRTVDHVELLGSDQAIVHLDQTAIDEPADAYLLHPALLDGALQGLLALLALGGREAAGAGFLPWRFGRVRLTAPFGRPCDHARLRLTRVGVKSASADLGLYDEAGELVAQLTECWFRRVDLRRRSPADEHMFHVDLVPAPLVPVPPVDDFVATPLERATAVFEGLASTSPHDLQRSEEGPLLDALVGAVALRVLRELAGTEPAFSVPQLVARELIAPASVGLAECLLRSIEGLGGAVEIEGEWWFQDGNDLPDATEIWRLLLADAPDLVAELALVADALDNLPRILAEGPAPSLSLSSAMVEHLLKASPASAGGIDLLSDALHEIAREWPVGRPLRVLEIGAHSDVTRRFLQRLAQSPTAVTYLATSADPEQVDRLSTMTRSFVGASARAWTPGETSEADIQPCFDIAVAVNACARLQLDAASLAMLRGRLAPGGLFLAVEPEPNALWDVAFGQTADWWLSGRSGDMASPLRSGDEWRNELTAAGFRAAAAASVGRTPWPCAVLWASAPPSIASVGNDRVEPRAIAVIAEDTPLRRALLDRLGAAGHCVGAVRPGDYPAEWDSVVKQNGVAEIVLFVTAEATGSAAQQVAALARIAHRAAERRATLWVVTCDAQQSTLGKAETGLVGAGLWGLARVLGNELPQLSVRLVDLPGVARADVGARQIADEIEGTTPETEIVWTPHGRHVLRLRAGLPPNLASPKETLTLASGSAGGFHSLGWEPRSLRSPGPGEVEIEVHAAGLNFRDVMWAMGLLPEEALIDGFAGPTFGLECAGIVRAVGAGVDHMAIGDRVMAFAPAALGTRVVTVADAVAVIPPEISFAAAATLPVAFVTVIYALGTLAQLLPGEHVLVHAAAGGVGLAAIQYAKHRGAVVIATAGSALKRRFLRLAGADYALEFARSRLCGRGP